MFQKISPLFSILIVVILSTLLVTAILYAWTEPTTSPPGGNVPAPINVGSTAQTKTGNLALPNLYLNATGAEGNIYAINQLIGYNDIFIKGNSAETAPIYLAGNQLSVYTAGIERLRVTSAGNVGIGTTAPEKKLHIVNSGLKISGGSAIEGGGNSPRLIVDAGPSTSHILASFRNDGGEVLRITGSNVGIGTTNPGYQLHIYRNSTNPNGIIIENALPTNAGHPAEIVFKRTGIAATQHAAVGVDYTARDFFIWVNGADRLNITESGNVGIGTTNPVQRLTVAGQIAINDNNTRIYEGSGNAVRIQTNSGYIDIGPQNTSYAHIYTNRSSGFYFNEELRAPAFYYTSDISFKKDIKSLSNSLEKILNLRGVSFVLKDNQESSIGLIAQEVEKIFPEVVAGKEGEKTIDYGRLVAPLIEAIKEQQKQINQLKAEIEELKAK